MMWRFSKKDIYPKEGWHFDWKFQLGTNFLFVEVNEENRANERSDFLSTVMKAIEGMKTVGYRENRHKDELRDRYALFLEKGYDEFLWQ